MTTTILRACFVIPVIAGTCSLAAQPYWTRALAGLGNDQINDVKVDDAGNIYVVGEFSGTAQFADASYTAVGGLDLFVAKLTADGHVLWWKQGGGFGLDRGIKLALGPGNTLAVVGEFMGDATFQGVGITSASFTADMFVALLDRNSGVQQWIRQGGGAFGGDRPYGVTISGAGQVTVVGEFRGDATWNAFALSSVPDPETAIPSVDVVVVSYDAGGTPLWIQHGAAEFTDRAIDVVNDPAGNIYVTGQFSDTITFDFEHLNAMFNATFLLKLDANGQEQWFRRCGGATYDHVRDMVYTADDQLLLVGDLQGTMIFLDTAPDNIMGEDPYNYYLLRVTTDGDLTASSSLGSSNGVSARGIDLRNDTIAVVGQFNCQFTSLAGIYGGSGLFMAAGGEDLFVTKHRYSDLGFIEARHFGGPGEKLAGQVATLPDGDVLVCGSFTRQISFATTVDHVIDIDPFLPYDEWEYTDQPLWGNGCPDLWEQAFASQDARGLKDGLLARAYVEDSVLYDWWDRTSDACEREAHFEMCAEAEDYDTLCADTVIACGMAFVTARLPFRPTFGETATVGPLIHVLWSNGDTSLTTEIMTTGLYHVQVDAANGCWSWSDSVHVIVHPMPPDPLISDDQFQNVNDPLADEVYICDPEDIAMWCTNIDLGTTWYWLNYPGDPLPPDTFFTDTVVADTSGFWTFVMTTDSGCTLSSHVEVYDLPTVPMQDLDLTIDWTFPYDTSGTDSVWLCTNSPLPWEVDASWWLNGTPFSLPAGLNVYLRLNGGTWFPEYDGAHWYGATLNYQEGWNTFQLDVLLLNDPCGSDSLLFTFTEDLWIGLWPVTPVSVTIYGETSMCVGDSVLLTVDCVNCTGLVWYGGTVYGDTTTSVWATLEGTYQVNGEVIDANGCSWNDEDQHYIEYPPGPYLLVDPADGIICPFDSALIFTLTPGTDQVWYGPNGPVPNASQQLWSSTPGEYFLTMTDLDGCDVTSDPVLLTGYGTPYLNVAPDNVLCLFDDEVLIQVVTTVPSSIVWAPPLSGGSLEQTVTQPGTYTVTATACGIVSELSVTVVASEVEAEVLDPGPFTICEGDSVTLEAAPGQALYIWQPGNVFADQLTVTQPGGYVLQAIDGNGCTANSDTIMVAFYEFDAPIAVTGDTICPGEQATLSATGSGSIHWYDDAIGSNLLSTGPLFTVNGLQSDTVFFVGQSDAQCTSLLLPVFVEVAQVDPFIMFNGPTEACTGTTITLTAFANGATQYVWITPSGPQQGASIVLDPVSGADAGLYICTASASNCGSTSDSLSLVVTITAPMDIGTDADICPGAMVGFSVDPSFLDVLWNGAPGGSGYSTGSEGWVVAQATDTAGCSATDSAFVNVLAFTQLLVADDVEVCEGVDTWIPVVGSGTLQWSLEADMDPVAFTGPSYPLLNPLSDLDLFIVQSENGCSSDTVHIHVTVNPSPTGIGISAPSFVCDGDTLWITLDAPPGTQVLWTTPNGGFSGAPLIVPGFTPDDAGSYVAYTSIGPCLGDTVATIVEFQPVVPFTLGPDTTFCNGGTITVAVPESHYGATWSTGASGPTIVVMSSGSYSAYAYDDSGCLSSDEVLIEGVDCDPVIPNIITPNGDGVHDSWVLDPSTAGFTSAELLVFDRNGNEVFRKDPALAGFAGENNVGEPLSEGVYFYVLRLVRLDGGLTEKRGYMHVNR